VQLPGEPSDVGSAGEPKVAQHQIGGVGADLAAVSLAPPFFSSRNTAVQLLGTTTPVGAGFLIADLPSTLSLSFGSSDQTSLVFLSEVISRD